MQGRCCDRRKWSKLINKVSNWTAVTSDEGQSFDTLKVCVFDGHDTSVSKQLLWVVIDELSACIHTHRVGRRSYPTFYGRLCNRGAIIFLSCGFFLLLPIFFPRLISAVADWMSTILRHMVWPLCKFRMQV